jgi:hypothetical protein
MFFHCTSLMTGAALCTFLVAVAVNTASLTPATAQTRGAVSADFRVALEPYGAWHSHKRWGAVWTPARIASDWRPYTVGHWVYSYDYGWYWVSDNAEANWGWVAYHYGRWVADDELGWVWVPGDDWAPAWVDWRQGNNQRDDYVGWAPLPPDDLIFAYDDNPAYWSFVRPRDLIAPRLAFVFLPLAQRATFMQRTLLVNRTIAMRDRHLAVNPGISPTHIAASAGRPIRTYDVRPRVLAGKTNMPGAIVVRAEDLRRGGRDRTAHEMVIARSQLQPARDERPPQALGHNENGRLGDNPPRAALGVAAPIQATPPAAQTTPPDGPAAVGQQRQGGAVPAAQPPAAQRPVQPAATTGQAPQQPNLGTNQHPLTTGAAPPAPRDINRSAEQRRGPAGRENRVAPQATPRERAAAPPLAARPHAPPPIAHQAPQAPAARVPAPQAPAAARAPITPQQAPAARAPVSQAPAAQAPRPQPPSTTGAAPRGGGPREERR